MPPSPSTSLGGPRRSAGAFSTPERAEGRIRRGGTLSNAHAAPATSSIDRGKSPTRTIPRSLHLDRVLKRRRGDWRALLLEGAGVWAISSILVIWHFEGGRHEQRIRAASGFLRLGGASICGFIASAIRIRGCGACHGRRNPFARSPASMPIPRLTRIIFDPLSFGFREPCSCLLA